MTDDQVSGAVRDARESEFPRGLQFSSLEYSQALETPSLRARMNAAVWVRLVKGIAIGAPFAGLLAPLGGADTGAFVSVDAFEPDTARAIAAWCFWIGAIGQVWVFIGWLRQGRPTDSGWRAWSAVAVVSAGIAAWWHVSLAPPDALAPVLVPIVVTGVLAAVVLIALLVASKAETRRAAMLRALGERLRALPTDEQAQLRAERTQIIEALRSRELIDAELAQRAEATALGEWWTLDEAAAAPH